jgi:uncharacterized membrane protein YecN with MAPEG domain
VSMKVSVIRIRKKVPLGDGGDIEVMRALSLQDNFNKFTPLFLILLGIYERVAYSFAYIDAFGIVYILAMLFEVFGVGYCETYSKNLKKVKHIGARAVSEVLVYTILASLSFLIILEKWFVIL